MRERLFAAVQYACLGTGALLVSMVALARLDGEAGRLSALESFEAGRAAPDQSLWSPERVRGYEASLGTVTEEPIAILRMPVLGLEVPVYASDSALHLNRGAGLIAGMGLPDKGGNLGIAGPQHRFHVGAEWIAVGLCIAIVAARRSLLIGLMLAAGLIAVLRATGIAA